MKFDTKLKKEYVNKLKTYYLSVFNKEKFIEESLYDLMIEITSKTNFSVSAVLTRKGVVVDLFVGTKNESDINALIKETKMLNGLRVIHTHPNGDCSLSVLDKSFLMNNRFDCVCSVGVDVSGVKATVGFYALNDPEVTTIKDATYINKQGLMQKIYEVEKTHKDLVKKMNYTAIQRDTAVLVLVSLDSKDNIEYSMEELRGLAQTAGISICAEIIQKRKKPDPKYFVGEGKLKELKRIIQINNANIVIFDNELSGSKQHNLMEALDCKVIDRSTLILDIFAQRARTNEGKLQVELAQLKYNLPRLNTLISSSGRFGAGVGMRGPGESKLELNRRLVENNIRNKEKKLRELKKFREISRINRLKNSKKTVAIVGYTNSGKSTLMNCITKAGVYVKDELFATLDTTTRNVWLDYNCEVLLTDTVGFVSKLPHEFIEAFGATLEECTYADLLLHVVDISNPNYKEQMKTVNKVLANLHAKAPVIVVYNKIDKIPGGLKYTQSKKEVYISAEENRNIDILKQAIIDNLNMKN